MEGVFDCKMTGPQSYPVGTGILAKFAIGDFPLCGGLFICYEVLF